MTHPATRRPGALRSPVLAAGAALLAAAALCAALAGAQQAGFAEAVALHDAGRGGDARATAKAVEAFEALVEAAPKDALANAYLGSAYALTARDSDGIPDKLRFTNRGLRHLDAAVALEPDGFVPRLIRANVASSLPAMFGRAEAAVEDMLVLDAMFARARAPSMAGAMVGIYEALSELAPDRGDWAARAAEARRLAGS